LIWYPSAILADDVVNYAACFEQELKQCLRVLVKIANEIVDPISTLPESGWTLPVMISIEVDLPCAVATNNAD